MRGTTILFSILLLFSACSTPTDNQIRLSTTTWIGYTPLFYAKQKGWLDEINIKLINVVSLSENMYLYQGGNSDAYCGTQYEHAIMKDTIPSLIPIILFDRSNGGDIIMSNQSIQTLQNSEKPIHTYLEMDSINYTLLQDFLTKFKIEESRIVYMDRDQAEISSIHNTEPDQLTLIVTYIPFNTTLEKNGFTEILSTKNGLDLLVVDALFTRKEFLESHKQQFLALKQLIDEAILVAQKEPEKFFTTVKPYMNGITYEEFLHSLDDIVWINSTSDPQLLERMRQASFPVKELL